MKKSNGSAFHLPAAPAAFAEKKQRILQQLSVPTAEYTDASPKGSIDVGIRDLIDELNALEGFVTTSSCAGRVSVFVEGVKGGAPSPFSATTSSGLGEDGGDDDQDEDDFEGFAPLSSSSTSPEAARPATKLAGVGGKGGGGNWLFVSHDPVMLLDKKEDGNGIVNATTGGAEDCDIAKTFGLLGSDQNGDSLQQASADAAPRLIHFKFEPMILHVLTASPEHAQLLLRCGLQAGFRESGAINLTAGPAPGEAVTPMVAIRSMGLLLESLVGEQVGNNPRCTVSPAYLRQLLDIANQRFKENDKRIARFRSAVLEATTQQQPMKKDGTEWEDAETRRGRKREEGLRLREEVQRRRQAQKMVIKAEDDDDDMQADSARDDANLT